jgi:RHS repeat-associated protein
VPVSFAVGDTAFFTITRPANAAPVRVQASGGTTTGPRYYSADFQGSTVAMTDGSGAVTATYDHDAFGEVIAESGSDAAGNAIRFNGAFGVHDRDTGLLEMRARFYDPALGRYTQRDPIGLQGFDSNRYRASSNNPVQHADPSGLAGVGIAMASPHSRGRG